MFAVIGLDGLNEMNYSRYSVFYELDSKNHISIVYIHGSRYSPYAKTQETNSTIVKDKLMDKRKNHSNIDTVTVNVIDTDDLKIENISLSDAIWYVYNRVKIDGISDVSKELVQNELYCCQVSVIDSFDYLFKNKFKLLDIEDYVSKSKFNPYFLKLFTKDIDSIKYILLSDNTLLILGYGDCKYEYVTISNIDKINSIPSNEFLDLSSIKFYIDFYLLKSIDCIFDVNMIGTHNLDIILSASGTINSGVYLDAKYGILIVDSIIKRYRFKVDKLFLNTYLKYKLLGKSIL